MPKKNMTHPIWMIETYIQIGEHEEFFYFFLRTERDAIQKNKEMPKMGLGKGIIKKVSLDDEDIREIMTVSQFEELFNVDVNQLIVNKYINEEL